MMVCEVCGAERENIRNLCGEIICAECILGVTGKSVIEGRTFAPSEHDRTKIIAAKAGADLYREQRRKEMM